MKQLYLIGGTMGVGKTTTSLILTEKSEKAVFLDGDWCWYANPFTVTAETKTMVLDNICHLLNNFIHCTAYENIIFCWVMHEQEIIDTLLSRLDTADCQVHAVSLVCTGDALAARLQSDIAVGKRTPDVIPRSIARLPLYDTLNTLKIDVSHISAEEAAELLCKSF